MGLDPPQMKGCKTSKKGCGGSKLLHIYTHGFLNKVVLDGSTIFLYVYDFFFLFCWEKGFFMKVFDGGFIEINRKS